MADNPAADLGAMIEERIDQEINDSVSPQGVNKVLGDIIDGMAAAFDPAAAGNLRALIQFDVTAPDGLHSYQLKVANGKCNFTKGGKEPARLVLALALPDFLHLIGGKLDEIHAFMNGQLRVWGDMQFAQGRPDHPALVQTAVNTDLATGS